jgi:hypothetical protein
MNARPIRWHRGLGPRDEYRQRGVWYAEVGGDWKIALAMVRDSTEVGDHGRYFGYIYGEYAEAVTLREFKEAVETVRALVVAALRSAQ